MVPCNNALNHLGDAQGFSAVSSVVVVVSSVEVLDDDECVVAVSSVEVLDDDVCVETVSSIEVLDDECVVAAASVEVAALRARRALRACLILCAMPSLSWIALS